MKKIYIALLVIVALGACSKVYFVKQPDTYLTAEESVEEDFVEPGDNGYKTDTIRPGWKFYWSDEFNGDTLDTSKWNYEVNGDGGGNNELQFYTNSKANLFFRKGKLVIKAIKQNYKGQQYTSARVNSRGKADFLYGRMEIRAKLPVQQGVWPAGWMLPTEYKYGTWPQSGEIDIVETIGNLPSTVHGTLHYGLPWPDNKWVGAKIELEKGKDVSTDYHVYIAEWEPNVIRFYLDDSLYATRTPADLKPHRWPFDQKFHFLLNLAIGGNWPGNPDDNTVFPKYMFVDYVRVFKRVEEQK
ncbi:MAG: glycoside hydrolase family 16 protein [Cytophagaceae bacterium]|jgi:beta-glucanase (GH16 family)|nr:glycoside hydrolase family 16 protein [Cytophagaceae bacterium]